MNKIQNFKENCFGHLSLAIWSLLGICDLEIGI